MIRHPLLEIRNLGKTFAVKGSRNAKLHAVENVSFSIGAGETLSLVGESGCGKSTVGRAILGLLPPSEGEIFLQDRRIDTLSPRQLVPVRKRIQVVFQDPFSSLNPRMMIREILAEPIRNFGIARAHRDIDAKVAELLDKVQLPAAAIGRYPHEFSGGQRQRIGIARALAPDPDIIIADEAVSALDVAVKAQIINLFMDIQAELGLALLFISHDLAIVEHLAHRVAVMYLGRIVEIADRRTIFSAPAHPYTRALISSVPVPDPSLHRQHHILEGDVPSPINRPKGCSFHTRCPHAQPQCKAEVPRLGPASNGEHLVACHLKDLPAMNLGPTP